MALAFDFSIAKEQVVLTPALKPIFNSKGAGLLTPAFVYYTASEKRNILSHKSLFL